MTNEIKNTENRLKNLKKGDPVYIRSCYECHKENGNILTTHYYVLSKEKQIKMHTCSTPENVLLPSALQPAPKYDPCRLFKRGDKAKVSTVKGRHFNSFAEDFDGMTVVVTIDEEPNSNIYVMHNEDEFTIDPAYLELVTPVEELDPYIVEESTDYFSVDKEEEELCLYWKDKHPHAKEAAEAERDRLNAEYRKERN